MEGYTGDREKDLARIKTIKKANVVTDGLNDRSKKSEFHASSRHLSHYDFRFTEINTARLSIGLIQTA